MPNMKFLSLAILELSAFNAQKLGATRPWPLPILPSFDIQGLAAAK